MVEKVVMKSDTQEEAARREEMRVKEIQRLEEELVEEQGRLERRLAAALEDKERAVKEVGRSQSSTIPTTLGHLATISPLHLSHEGKPL